ncbi:MAG: zinc ribbon domain-containing protein, partial [Faecalibacterium sp.]|nr:zinc ribbon domain-containing protein [Faecalibacterium sp.]
MYCTRCNSYNDDNARFCNNCGAELFNPQPQQDQQTENNVPPQGNFNGGFSGMPNNNSPYGQPMYTPQTGKYTNVLPIVAIIVSVLNFNILGI